MHQDFSNCYVQLKAILRSSHGILCAPFVSAVIQLAKKNQNYPNVATASLTFSEIVELRISASFCYLHYGISILLSIVVVLICIPTKIVCFFTSTPAFIVAIALEFGHSNWDVMKSSCRVDWHLFYNQGCEHSSCI
jgi:hypothetical protein